MSAKREPTGKVKGTLMIDGHAHDCWAESVEAIAGAQAYLDGLASKIADDAAQMARQALIDARNSQIAAKDAEIAALRRRVDDQLKLIDQRTTELVEVRDAAKKVLPSLNTEGMSAKDIRIAVIKSQAGEHVLDGKSDDYIAARFDFIADAVKTRTSDPFALVVRDGVRSEPAGRAAVDQAYAQMVDQMTNAHKSPSGDDAA